jgi:hypothetical protein
MIEVMEAAYYSNYERSSKNRCRKISNNQAYEGIHRFVVKLQYNKNSIPATLRFRRHFE